MTRIEIILSGSTTAHVEGRTFALSERRARAGVIPTVARALLAEGHDPGSAVRVTRDGTKVFEDATLGAWANVCVEESDRQSARLRKYRPWKDAKLVGGSAQEQAEELEGTLA